MTFSLPYKQTNFLIWCIYMRKNLKLLMANWHLIWLNIINTVGLSCLILSEQFSPFF